MSEQSDAAFEVIQSRGVTDGVALQLGVEHRLE